MPFIAPKITDRSSTPSNAAGRTTFRPPWVKEDTAATTAVKPVAPWVKKPATRTAERDSKVPAINNKAPSAIATNATKSGTESATKKTSSNGETPKKVFELVKKPLQPAQLKNATQAPLNAMKTPLVKPKQAPPPPPVVEESDDDEDETEEESDEETEEETEEESEEESEEEDESEEESVEEPVPTPTPATKAQPGKTATATKTIASNQAKPAATTTTIKMTDKVPEHVKKATQLRATTMNKKKSDEESELKQRFTIEKPKLRSMVTIKRDKSMKKIDGDAQAKAQTDADAVEGETEEERERRLRFKLEKPQLRHVKREEKLSPSKSNENILKIRPVLKKVPKIDELLKEPKGEPKPEFKTKTLRKTPSIKRELSIKNVPAPPPLPSLVPKAPPPPPPVGGLSQKRALTETQLEALEKLKTRPRRRPDWSEMMKEVESGKKLRHVTCNDRSQPILTCKSMTKVDNKFIYETEKDNSHNKLLKQIQGGVKLKPTQTNDRSKPILDGLRKFRRQMTIEEQLQKSQSRINILGEAATSGTNTPVNGKASLSSGQSVDCISSEDELDDIDKIRDDLQSTKQMLALELRNREAQERENKKLLAKIATLEAELEREKSREKNLEYGSNVIVATMDPLPTREQAYVNSLKSELEDARKSTKEVETNYRTTSELLDEAKTEIEEQKRQIQMLERKLAYALQGGGSMNGSRRPSDVLGGREGSSDFELEISESDQDEAPEKKAERQEKRLAKDVKNLISKLTKVKAKEETAKKEKEALKQAMKKNHILLKEENKKFKKLEKEVEKMAASMKLDADDDDDDYNEDPENGKSAASNGGGSGNKYEEGEEESEESESEESESDHESDSEPEGASNTEMKEHLEPRLKAHECRLNAMKKCNVLLQANVDNLQDQIMQVKSKASSLQGELDTLLADLGF